MDLQRFHLLCARVRVVVLALLGAALAWVALGLLTIEDTGRGAAPAPAAHAPPGLRAAAG